MNESLTINQALDSTSSTDTATPSRLKKIQKRRKILIDRSRQLRTAALTSSLAAFLLVVVNIAFYALRTSQTMFLTSVAPQLEPVLADQDARFSAMLSLFSLIFVAGVFLITIYQTHLTAGAVFAVKRTITQLRDGDYRTRLRLRPRDTLQNLTEPFNDMVASLRENILADAGELDRLAERAAAGDTGAPELAEALRDLAARKRELVA